MSKPSEKKSKRALERDLRALASRLNNLDIGKRLKQLPNQMSQKMCKLDETDVYEKILIDLHESRINKKRPTAQSGCRLNLQDWATLCVSAHKRMEDSE
jgi:hypothetical protein